MRLRLTYLYESGDKVTLRNCFPQADESELSPPREPRLSFPSFPSPRSALSSLPSTKSNSPLPLVPATSRFLLVAPLQTHLFPAWFYSVLLRRSTLEEESRIYVKSMREGVLRNRYFVTGEITTCVIRGLSISSRGFLCRYLSRVFRFYQTSLDFYRSKLSAVKRQRPNRSSFATVTENFVLLERKSFIDILMNNYTIIGIIVTVRIKGFA